VTAAVVVCAAAGAALAAGGIRLIRKNEVPEGDTSFTRVWSPRALGTAGGWIALFLGLLLLFVGAPMAYLTP